MEIVPSIRRRNVALIKDLLLLLEAPGTPVLYTRTRVATCNVLSGDEMHLKRNISSTEKRGNLPLGFQV